MATDNIRIGIVGAGTNTKTMHIPGLRKIDGVEIVSVCNRSRKSSQKVAKTFRIPKVYDNWRQLVAADDTDGIVIGTWPYMHCPVTLAALGANKHVLCEARMAMNADEARTMRDVARSKPHLVTQVVPAPMSLGVDATVNRLLSAGYLGRVLAVEVRGGGAFLDPNAPLHWRQDVGLSGHNIMSMGIWYEIVLRWLGEAVRVAAMGQVFTKMRKDGDGRMRAVRVPEHVDVIGDMACGAQLHMQISAVTGLAGESEILLFGSKATLRFADDKLFGGRKGDKTLKEIAIPAKEKGGWRVEEEFINAIRGKEKVKLTTFDDGVKYMEFTDAVVRSMATGKTVAIPAA